MAEPRICSVDGCGKPIFTKASGLCSAHYNRRRRNGDHLAGRIPPGEKSAYLTSVVVNYRGADCLIWPFSKHPNGYAYVDHDGRRYLAHRLVCELVYGPAPSPEHEAAHTCGKGHEGCVSPHHVRWATHKENERDKLCHGTVLKGESHGCAKLTEDDVRKIKALIGERSQRELARCFGVCQQQISRIKSGKLWSHVD